MKKGFSFFITFLLLTLSPMPAAASYTKVAADNGFLQACRVVAETLAAAAVMLWRWCTGP